MKIIEIHNGNKTIYKAVDGETVEEKDWQPKDISTSLRKGLSMGDIPAEKWNKIFGDKNNG